MSAFQEIYEAYGKPVYRFLLALSGDETMAEELLQETFYQAFCHVDQFEGRCSEYTWLCQIGKNAWLKECRRRRRFEDHALEDLTLPDRTPGPEESSIRRDQYQRTRRAIYHLEDPYKDVLILHLYGGLKLKEIAAAYGKTESWARVTYYRARQRIIEEVQP